MNLIDIEALIKKADELQPLPASAGKLVALLSQGESDVDEITRIIRFDPALTMRLIRMANSAFSGASMTITTVQEAVSRLGTSRVLSLGVASHARPMLRVKLGPYGYEEGELWRHSVVAMLVAELAPKVCKVPVPPASSTAALLHDIGKLVMASFLDLEVLDLLSRAHTEGGLSQMEAESQILQIHHGELGGLIARHWKLPESIVAGITYHHNPEQGIDAVCEVVHLADTVAKHVEASLVQKKSDAVVNKAVVENLGLGKASLEWLCTESIASFTKVGPMFGAS
jgi:putative nucleotidyltransferase with HDIG domain